MITDFVSDKNPFWLCPHCKRALVRAGTGWVCQVPGHTGIVSDVLLAERLSGWPGAAGTERDEWLAVVKLRARPASRAAKQEG